MPPFTISNYIFYLKAHGLIPQRARIVFTSPTEASHLPKNIDFIDIDESATVTLEGEEQGKITFTSRFLADSTCQHSTDQKTFKEIKEVPLGLGYSLYTLSGRLLDKGEVDEYIHNYIDPKTYFIKIDGYKLKKIVFKG